jgi:MFS family permease
VHAPAAPRFTFPRGFAPLGYPGFAIYWFGYLSANTGKWAEQTGAVWLAYELTSSPAAVGLLGLVRAIPAIILFPIAGVIADRVDQRRILFATQGLSLLASATLTFLVATGRVEIWHLYLQVALQSAFLAVDNSARQALFPRLVPRDALVGAVTLQSTAAFTSSVIGPVVGGVAITTLGDAAPFACNALTNVVLMAAVLQIRDVAPRVQAAAASFRAELLEGFRYLLREPVLGAVLKMQAVFSIFHINPVNIAIIAREVLGVGADGLGLLLAADSLGGLVGMAVLLTKGAGPHQGRVLVLGTVAYAICVALLAVASTFLVGFLVLTAVGVFEAVVAVTRNSAMQLVAPGQLRGRVMANFGMITRGVSPLSQAQSGFLADIAGAPVAVLVAAVAIAINAAFYARRGQPVWTFASPTTDTAAVESRLQPHRNSR